MIINDKSTLKDVLQALAGTWNLNKNKEDGWCCIELGKIRIFKRVLESGSTVLPKKFLNNRKEVCPVMLFTKKGLTGQTLDLQQNAIDVKENCVCIIIQF